MSPHEEHPSAAKQHTKRKVSLLFILLFGCVGYSSILYMMANIVQDWRQDRQAAAATRAVDYPWLYYPISEESKQALCAALSLPPEHAVCRANREVMFGETSKTLREVFPEKKTTFSQVEERLSSFPHIKEVTYDLDGNMNSFRYVFRLTEHEGACTVLQISLEDLETVERIYGSHYDSLGGAGPTECWGQSAQEEIHPPPVTPTPPSNQQSDN